MPLPQCRDWGHLSENSFIADQLNYNRDSKLEAAQTRKEMLNDDQRSAYNQITTSVLSGPPKMFFLNGPGGTGKTFFYNTVCHRVRSETFIVLCVASSGIAALLLNGGQTAHSTFKIPVEQLHQDSSCGIIKESRYAEMLRIAKLLIWDEAGNQSRFALKAVDRSLQDIRNDKRPFGGMTVVFGGNFQQTLPIVPRGSHSEIVSHSLRCSPLWDFITILKLHQNMRLHDDPVSRQYADWIMEVGNGSAGENVAVPEHMQAKDLDTLIDAVYSGLCPASSIPPPDYFLNRSILSAQNDDVDGINHRIMDRFPGHEEILLSADSIECSVDSNQNDANRYPIEYLRSLRPSGMPHGELRLKVGCPVILLRNLAPRRGLCNGTRLILLKIGERVLEARIIGGEHNGEVVFIPRVTLTSSNSSAEFSFQLKRRQFPIRATFAMTINKAQGQSVRYVGLDL
jgi:hypothetical protein